MQFSENSKIKLSIVIPAWNEEKYIGQCLDYAIREASSFPNQVEIIVVDNASTDKTPEIIKKYPGTIYVREDRKGLSYARQAGFMSSRGDLIANIDADALLPAGWIKKVFQEFSNNTDLVALSGPYVYYDMTKTANFFVDIYYRLGFILHIINHRILRSGAMLQGGNFVLKRSALEQIGGYDVSISFYGEDADIARRIQKIGRVRFDFDLKMPTSARRFKKEGLFLTAWRYVSNFFWVIIFRHPLTKRYKYVGDQDPQKIKRNESL